MREPSFPFDAVLFDMDGTLVATDRFWVQAARTGARRAFAELGIDPPMPSAAQLTSQTGRPLAEVFPSLFPDLDAAAVLHIQEACLAEERRLLEAGGAALMPGAWEVLQTLKRAGVHLGIASNCTEGYLRHMVRALRLDEVIDEVRCLDSPGVAEKADMIEQELTVFDTRSAVMVGDRRLDREAAWANGLPHVHCAFGFAPADEAVGAEGRIEDLGELPDLLEGRRRWIDAALEQAGFYRGAAANQRLFGIGGAPAAGKGLFARDAARILRERGIDACVVPLDAFRRSGVDPDGRPPEQLLAAGFDVDALFEEVLEPAARGEAIAFSGTALDREGVPREARVDAPPGAAILLEGSFLADPRLRARLDRLIHLRLSDELILRRVAGREGRRSGPGPLERLRSGELSAGRAFDARYDPARLADLVLDASNPLGG